MRRARKLVAGLGAGVVLALATAQPAMADFIDWGQWGPDLFVTSSPPVHWFSTLEGVTKDGVAFTLEAEGANFVGMTEGDGWYSAFKLGTPFVYVTDNTRPTITFENPISSLQGLQMQAQFRGKETVKYTALVYLGNALIETATYESPFTTFDFGKEGQLPTFHISSESFDRLELFTDTGGSPFGIGSAAGVPEPQVWTMMLAGFGMLGASMRRRRPFWSAQARSSWTATVTPPR